MTVKNRDLWVIGTGPHSQHYLKVLQSLNAAALIVGRSKEGCKKFQRNMGTEAYVGGVQKALEEYTPPSTAIVSVDYHKLSNVSEILLNCGVKQPTSTKNFINYLEWHHLPSFLGSELVAMQ